MDPHFGDELRCLALSGGGLRSGTTSLGVIQELHLAGELSDFDIVSSVSGGGYPIYGILMKLGRDDASLDELLREGSEFITNIENEEFLNYSDLRSKALVTTVFTPLNAITSPVTNLAEIGNPNTVSGLYAKNIHDTFYKFHLFYRTYRLGNIDRNMLRRKGFPYPIFVTSANRGSKPPKKAHFYHRRDIFELSPDWIGSANAGYYSTPRFLDLWKAIAASAAAIDSPMVTNCTVVDGGRLCDAGTEVSASEDPRAERDPQSGVPDTLKWIGVGAGIPIRLHGEAYFLSDGGFIENLAILPLLTKGCDSILALDASSDPDLKFGELRILEDYVEQLGGELGGLERIDRGVPNSGWRLKQGVIEIDARLNDQKTTIHLLKLGINKPLIDTYPEPVSTYARENWSPEPRKSRNCMSEYPQTVFEAAPACGKLDRGLLGFLFRDSCSFPHENTFRLCYEPSEVRAYRYLGRNLACEYLTLVGRNCALTKEPALGH